VGPAELRATAADPCVGPLETCSESLPSCPRPSHGRGAATDLRSGPLRSRVSALDDRAAVTEGRAMTLDDCVPALGDRGTVTRAQDGRLLVRVRVTHRR
jgi:hypothetical protein